MKNNDLSNSATIVIGVQCINFLFEEQSEGFKNKLLNTLVGRQKRMTTNERVLNLLNYIFRETEYTVDLVVSADEYTEYLKERIDTLPFNRVVITNKPSDITGRLLIGDLSYYVDTPEGLELVNNKNCKTLDEIYQIIRRQLL